MNTEVTLNNDDFVIENLIANRTYRDIYKRNSVTAYTIHNKSDENVKIYIKLINMSYIKLKGVKYYCDREFINRLRDARYNDYDAWSEINITSDSFIDAIKEVEYLTTECKESVSYSIEKHNLKNNTTYNKRFHSLYDAIQYSKNILKN